jgi:hypothetical protein
MRTKGQVIDSIPDPFPSRQRVKPLWEDFPEDDLWITDARHSYNTTDLKTRRTMPGGFMNKTLVGLNRKA